MSMVATARIPTNTSTIAEFSPSVLIVEDDAAAVSEFAELLEMEGLGCVVADTPDRALSFMDAFSSIKVIVTDFYLSGGNIGANNGLSLVKNIRDRFVDRKFETIVISGDKNVVVDCALTGVDKFLAKPVAPENFCAIVRSALETAPLDKDLHSSDGSNLTLLNIIENQADAIATLTQALSKSQNDCRNAMGRLDRLVSAASIAQHRIHDGRSSEVNELINYITGQGYSLKKLLHCRAKPARQADITSVSTITF